jgi:hypothetical protein
VEAAKGAREHDRKEEDPRPEHKDVAGPAQLEISDPAHEEIAYREVEEPPENIYRGR